MEVHRALALPVVPEVKAISATSSAAVSTVSKRAGACRRERARASPSRRAARCSIGAGARLVELGGEPRVGQRERDLAPCRRLGQLARAQQRHRADDDAAGLEHGEPAGGQHRACWRRAAARGCRARCPGRRPARARCGWRAPAARRRSSRRRRRSAMRSPSPRAPAVEQLGGAVQPRRVGSSGSVEAAGPATARAAAGGRGRRCRRARWCVIVPLRAPRGDEQRLDLCRALVDAQRPDLAVEPLDRLPARHAAAAEELHGLVDHALRGLGGEELGHRGLARDPLAAASRVQAAR